MNTQSRKCHFIEKIWEPLFYEAIDEWAKENPSAKNDLAKTNLMHLAKIYNRKVDDRCETNTKEENKHERNH
tara:strand:- start:835 stop:1050 length:216 start_codon:yes stop_codon:yes gene_type:complete